MAGGRNKHGGGGGQPPFKKRKRSKAFWQQRETLDTKSRMPQANSESSSESDAGSVDENEVPESQYQSLLTAFSNGRQGETKIVDDEDKSSGSATQTDLFQFTFCNKIIFICLGEYMGPHLAKCPSDLNQNGT